MSQTIREQKALSILNRQFKYVPAAQTDISKTIRREQKRLEAEKKQLEDETERVVKPLIKARM